MNALPRGLKAARARCDKSTRRAGRRGGNRVRIGRLGRRLLALAALGIPLAGAKAAEDGGDARKGREIAIKYCARCHVVGDYNRMGGIGSTPSFQLLARRSDYKERFQTFYQRRPHPAFITVPGVPRWTKLPAYATPFSVEVTEIQHILAFVEGLRKMPPKRAPRRRRRF